jgi:hypothetical protein
VRGSGIRSDRPIFMLRQYPLAAGTHRVRVDLERREPPDPLTDTAAAPASALARRVHLDTLVVVPRGSVLLVTYDAGRFVVGSP